MANSVTRSLKGRRLLVTLLVAGAFGLGFLFRGGGAPPSAPAPASMPAMEHDHGAASGPGGGPAERHPEFWTCAMHPQIRLPKAGKCPICAMDLIPYYGEDAGAEAEASPRRLVMSPTARELADIQTTAVTRQYVEKPVRMVGKIAYDETRLGYITSRFPGRIDELYVDYTGVTVKKGDHMAELYSPELISAQEELFQALEARERLKDSQLEVMRRTAASTVQAARDKLRLWDLTPKQIEEIERSRTIQEHVTIYSPMSGIVIHRNATEGMYIDTGTRIYTIAKLDLVWVMLEAYESDIAWLRYGQDVAFTTEAYPGETFHGRIAFIDPVLDPKTRTIRVRANVPNPDGRLKPDMFVRSVVRSTVSAGGFVIDPSLEGKWISPMHPEIVRDEPGNCPVCGMPLVRPEELGLMPAMPSAEAPLVIPASAPLITGKRAVVYVEAPNAKKPTYEGREISLGPRADDYYIVLDGLREGERVVTQGNFKIDSALQIQAKPSMMSPEGGVPQTGHAGHGGGGDAPAGHQTPAQAPGPSDAEAAAGRRERLRIDLGPIHGRYFAIHRALAQDDAEAAAGAFAGLHADVRSTRLAMASDPQQGLWRPHSSAIESAAAEGMKAQGLAELRAAFVRLSDAFLAAERAFGHTGAETYYEMFCPMANDGRGAAWLQTSDDVRNPYYGKGMLTCGSLRGTHSPIAEAPGMPPGPMPDAAAEGGPATQPTAAPAAPASGPTNHPAQSDPHAHHSH